MNATGQNFFRVQNVFTADTDNFAYMIQGILVGIIFIAAIIYVGSLLYRGFQSRNACSTGCGKCGAIDFKKLEEQLKKSSQFTVDRSQPRG